MGILKYLCFAVMSLIEGYSNTIPVYIALKQNNIPLLEGHLERISNPLSDKYGTYYTADEIHSFVDPPLSHQNLVIDWLLDSNITSFINYGDAIKFSAPKDKLLKLFDIHSTNTTADELVNYNFPPVLDHVIDFVEMATRTKQVRQKHYIKPRSSSSASDDRFFWT